jgi:hypothetical protein
MYSRTLLALFSASLLAGCNSTGIAADSQAAALIGNWSAIVLPATSETPTLYQTFSFATAGMCESWDGLYPQHALAVANPADTDGHLIDGSYQDAEGVITFNGDHGLYPSVSVEIGDTFLVVGESLALHLFHPSATVNGVVVNGPRAGPASSS